MHLNLNKGDTVVGCMKIEMNFRAKVMYQIQYDITQMELFANMEQDILPLVPLPNDRWDTHILPKLHILTYVSRIHVFTGSLESPLTASSSTQAYHPSSTYFHHECQWFFDPPPARQLILKISTAQKMSE